MNRSYFSLHVISIILSSLGVRLYIYEKVALFFLFLEKVSLIISMIGEKGKE